MLVPDIEYIKGGILILHFSNFLLNLLEYLFYEKMGYPRGFNFNMSLKNLL